MSEDLALVYSTAPSAAVAEAIAEALLKQGLIACANIVPGMTSMYRWQGEIVRDSEVLVVLKTRAAMADAAIEVARALHPYDTPAFVVLPIQGGHAPFLDWIRHETPSH